MENQALGLAEAVARLRPLDIAIKRADLTVPFRWLPYNALALPGLDLTRCLTPDSDAMAAPWPDLLIGCGRIAAGLSIAVRRHAGGETFTVQTQDPRILPSAFDLVLPPAHDELTGPNVLPLLGSPNRITKAVLTEARTRFADLFTPMGHPLAGVLIGGDSKSHRLTSGRMEQIIGSLRDLTAKGVALAITTSRRTGEDNEARLRDGLAGTRAWIWDGSGDNPYFGLLAHADALLVTEESTNMITEAGVTGKPVHVLALEGGNAKFDRFHAAMAARGVTRPFTGTLGTWTYAPLDETARAARVIDAALSRPEGAGPLDLSVAGAN